MTITWNNTTICHGPDRSTGQASGPFDLAINCLPVLIRRLPIEGPGPLREETGNDETTIAFGVNIRCANVAAAAAKLIAVTTNTPRTGQLEIGTLKLKGAGLTKLEARAHGVTIRVTYEFAGYL